MNASVPVFATYFDKVYIINLPSRPDRLNSVIHELDRLGFADSRDRISVPYAPMPFDANGFPAKGVYGNFLSHLGILRDARAAGFERILVLEDDAIFRRSAAAPAAQAALIADVERCSWAMWFPGHALKSTGLSTQSKGIAPTTLPFIGAHCYAVHARAFQPLIAYLEATEGRPRGHPEGGRMYIDGAYSMFRKLYPEHICLISNPALSIQKGTTSDLGKRKQYDASRLLNFCAQRAREARDEFWRWTGIDFRRG
jgi:glycosyl transferase, family 25